MDNDYYVQKEYEAIKEREAKHAAIVRAAERKAMWKWLEGKKFKYIDRYDIGEKDVEPLARGEAPWEKSG
ncbi:MAG: hypothetical protein Q7J73_08185 [Dehalococcoidales bacterium]|nr:hypothetical protein [Dehalococcoidales bacterium]